MKVALARFFSQTLRCLCTSRSLFWYWSEASTFLLAGSCPALDHSKVFSVSQRTKSNAAARLFSSIFWGLARATWWDCAHHDGLETSFCGQRVTRRSLYMGLPGAARRLRFHGPLTMLATLRCSMKSSTPCPAGYGMGCLAMRQTSAMKESAAFPAGLLKLAFLPSAVKKLASL